MYVGETERLIRNIFAYARAFKALHGFPLVVFIDEADAILPSRTDPTRRTALWEESQVAAFLAEMDGMRGSGAFVVLATNRPEAIDPAILRDGRIDRKIKVVRPGYEETVKIASMHLAEVPLADLPGAADAAKVIADEAFDPDRKIYRIRHSGGPSFFRFCNIMNGAMVGGFVQRAKMHAFRRDIASGGKPVGITRADLVKAVSDAFEEERRLDHNAALLEMIEDAGLSGCTVDEVNDAPSAPRGVAKH